MLDFYQKNIYGTWRSGEKVSYQISKGVLNEDGEPENAKAKLKVSLCVEANEKTVNFDVNMYVPKDETREQFGGKSPFIVCMHPIQPKDYALGRGYAIIELDTLKIASDDCKHNGAFYDLYPYGNNAEEQTGVLMAWAWGASKALDAVYAGLCDETMLDVTGAIVTGVSRWGKATAVCGAFDDRFTFVAPTCSGAGGLALNNYVSEGKTYNFESIGGPSKYTYSQNEPLSCLQSDAERGWFNDEFLKYKTMADIPYEQYMLVDLAASKNRFYMIIASCMNEDWVNSPAMWECFLKADVLYKEKGLSEHLIVNFHKEGHAVIDEDMEILIDYFNYMKYGIGKEPDFNVLKTSVFARQ